MTLQNEQGRTMLEMLGVISIIGIITYGAIAGINYGMSSYKINKMYSEVQEIIQGVEDLYSWSKGYPTGPNAIMLAAEKNDIFSSETRTCSSLGSAKCVQGAYSDVHVRATDSGDNFEISYYAIPSEDCNRITQLDWDSLSLKYTLFYEGCEKEWDKDPPCTCPEDGKPVGFAFQPI